MEQTATFTTEELKVVKRWLEVEYAEALLMQADESPKIQQRGERTAIHIAILARTVRAQIRHAVQHGVWVSP